MSLRGIKPEKFDSGPERPQARPQRTQVQFPGSSSQASGITSQASGILSHTSVATRHLSVASSQASVASVASVVFKQALETYAPFSAVLSQASGKASTTFQDSPNRTLSPPVPSGAAALLT